MARARPFRLGIRGRLILGVLALVALSLWLLGVALLRQNAVFLAAERRARARAVAVAAERALGPVLQAAGGGPGPGPHLAAVQDLLGALAEDPAVASLALRDADGRLIASAGWAGAPTGDGPDLSRPVRVAGAPPVTLEVTFAPGEAGRQAAFAHLQVLAQLGITAVVIVVFLQMLLAFTVLGPIRRLLAATGRVAAGDLDHSVDSGRDDEIGDLAAAFNAMQERLRESRRENLSQLDSLHRAHAELLASRERLVAAERLAAVGRVAAGVAHEVGNPLGAVTGYVAMLRGGGLSGGEAAESLERTEREVARINRIMVDLLNYARPPRVEPVEVDLGALVRDLGQHLATQPDFQDVRLLLEAPPGLPPVRTDYHLARQILLNLAVNAAQAMPGGGTVRLEAFPGPPPGVRVGDDGPGIPAEILPMLFEPFATSGKRRGTGLGLAISRRSAEALGARIDVETAPGGGTSFTVTFPPAAGAGPAAAPTG